MQAMVQYLNIPHLSTGEMLREVKRQDSALSRWVASYIDAGRLAPDHLVMRIVAQRLKEVIVFEEPFLMVFRGR